MRILLFENWQESERLKDMDNATGVFSSDKDHDLACSGCGNIHVAPKHVQQFLCNSCEDAGWWIDPSGGIHQPDDEEDFEDPAAMYERMYESYYGNEDDDGVSNLDEDEYNNPPIQRTGIGKFNHIDWQQLHETLMINTFIARDKIAPEIGFSKLKGINSKTGVFDGDAQNISTNYTTYNYTDFVNDEGYLTPQEFTLLEDNDVFLLWGGIPIIENDLYRDYETFKAAAEKAWNKQ